MKRLLFSTVFCLLSSLVVWAQDDFGFRVIDTTLVFPTESYVVMPDFDDENAIRIAGHSPTIEKPFPGRMISCGILEDEIYEDCVAEFTDKVIIKEDALISLGNSLGYLKETYLQNVAEGEISSVSFLDNSMKGFWRKKVLFVYPFHYDYQTKTLSLWTKVHLRVRMKKSTEQYRPFIEDGKEWITGQLISSEGNKNTYSEISRIYFDGDTLVGDHLCKRWMKQTTHLLEAEPSVSSTLIAPIFEENQQVFFFYPNEIIPRLLYDFQNQNEKQQIEVYSIYDDTHQPHTFTRTASTKDYDSNHYPVPTRWYEVIPKDNNEGFSSQTWIEGIGSKLSPELNIFGKSETLPVMSRCQVGNSILCRWWADDLSDIYKPEPTYHPFVERGKYWYVHRFNAITNEHDAVYYTFSADKDLISIDGHEYLPMTARKAAGREYLDREVEEKTLGLFREEDKKVYFRQSAEEAEQLVYDFSLNVGDEYKFPPLMADEGVMEVTAIGQTILAEDTLKTISFNTAGEPTWIEGIGYTSSPLAFMSLPPNGDYYVTAYVGGTNYLPLTFSEPYLSWWGTDLTRVRSLDIGDYPANASDSLSYELVPDPEHNGELSLHVSGHMWTHSGPHNYIYCVCEPTDGPEDVNVMQISLIKEPLYDTTEIGLYEVNIFFPRFPKGKYIAGGHQVTISKGADYRPFIEDGKVWKVGWFGDNEEDSLVLMREEIHYFEGDTIVGDRLCKKMITKTTIACDDAAQETHYAVYEDDRHVYTATSDGTFIPLYDFASEEGTLPNSYFNGEGPGTIKRKLYVQDGKFHGWITYITGLHSIMNPDYDVIRWMEGVGCQGFYNSFQFEEIGAQRRLISCTVGDEVLYYDSLLVNAQTLDNTTIGDVKKQQLDFTHVVKPRPKAPRQGVSETREEENLTGEYSLKELFVNFKPLAGLYAITICDAAGKEVYRKEVQTSNVVGLNTDISGYGKGEYTITVENDTEEYTATFSIGNEDGIRIPTSDLSRGEKAAAVYDLSGRRLSTPSARGIYIREGKKIKVVK